MKSLKLPVVSGRRVKTYVDFELRLLVALGEEQEKFVPDIDLVELLSDAVRCVREYVDSLKRSVAISWQPIETAPRDGSYIIIAGPSGYTTTPIRCDVAHWIDSKTFGRFWATHSNDRFTDGGEEPTHWMPLPSAQ